jgi:glucose-1-phosphate thymidylyltransferase
LIKSNKINVVNLYRGTLWLDTGTFENLYQCSSIIYSIEKNTNVMVGCIEEIAFSKNWITKKQLINSIANKNSQYYLSLLKTIGHKTNLSKISN